MRKIILLLLLSGLVWALEIQGPAEPVTILRGRTERLVLRLKNDTNETEKIKPGFFSGRQPAEAVFLTMPENELTLRPFSEQECVLQIRTADFAEPGDYLYWLTFSRDIHRQSNESGDFTVQDIHYYPLQFVCRIVKTID